MLGKVGTCADAGTVTDQLLPAWCAVQEVVAAPVVNGNGAAAAAAAAAVEQPGEDALSRHSAALPG
jgi:hypothetical protein